MLSLQITKIMNVVGLAIFPLKMKCIINSLYLYLIHVSWEGVPYVNIMIIN